ncbi:bifunctional riboflavin kinase/FAD synthetase [Acetohalobium arabaticum]|uniref:Riboflavin biosynthesis protein n=1 Tax=Acetohalobium arabaticum (strain ATCC 49924 / DSM 5501 / Z-7288) TaxID=574087 RepID=D9QRF8_ACEAZ|nr:bifunctional riboflavin kinase/FAD synthetase [Acetohalobium arabaticum]ADL13099.1 riboflavin biosynthesis protein RibF [Acetohalobium arabaticum DSM 5501]
MEIINGEEIKSETESVVAALGAFDGIHYGHQQLIDEVITTADRLNCKAALFSFKPHPLSVVAPSKAPPLITSWKQKYRILEELGLDKVYLVEFTADFAKLDFKGFVRDYLVAGINVHKVVVGEDFRFGYQGLGDTIKLKKLGAEFGFEVKVIDSVTIDNKVVSSTYIRELIEAGRLQEVKTYLTRNYSIEGKVIDGDKRGRELGFPTANLKPVADYIIPKSGVYAVYVYLEGTKMAGAAHVGSCPTFNQDELSIEVNIFDFDDDIYQEKIEVEFVEGLRSEMEFNSRDGLIKQIMKDIAEAKDILEV